MPIRFQVDADFYDHPKSINLSDAATALWVRAGSYSAAKLLDGFIAEHVISTLSRSPEEAAEELVARGLWRRVRGGWRFHQWEQRNLTRARVEADRKADRNRKREGRKAPGQNEKPEVNGQVVRPESIPDSAGNPNGVRPLSVSVSVSESVSESGHGSPSPPTAPPVAAEEPPSRCPKHLDDHDPPPCGPCGSARRAHEAWQADQVAEVARRVRAEAERRSEQARAQAEATRLAIERCDLCDERGYLDAGHLCTHDPVADQRAHRGAAAARAALTKGAP
jgi:sRNA-binding protein